MHALSPPSSRGAKRRSNPGSFRREILDCFAEPVIGPRFARTRWLAMTECEARVVLRQLAPLLADTPSHPRGSFRPSFASSHPPCQRAQGRPGAGRAPTVHCAKGGNKNLHSGIQVKPNIRPSLRSGFTTYAEFSPGSVALLPPSPCGWLMRGPGRAATSPQDLTHRSRAPGRHGFAVRGPHRSCARWLSLTVARPATPFAPMLPASTAAHPACRDDRDTPL